MLVTGFIQELKEWPSKYTYPDGSPKPSSFSMKVDEKRFGLRGKPPQGLKAGDFVQFDAIQNDKDGKTYWNVDATSIIPAKAPDGVSAPAPQERKFVGGSSFKKKSDWDNPARQDSITYQSARKDSLETVSMLLRHDLIDFGKARGAQKIELVEIFIDNYTKRFFEDTKRLAPPDHSDPTQASYGEDVEAARKPRGRPKKEAVESVASPLSAGDVEDEDSPWEN